jgi:hypothetical protein
MSEINYFKVFVLCKIMWYDVVVICQLLDDVAVDNWWMMLTTPCMSGELH